MDFGDLSGCRQPGTIACAATAFRPVDHDNDPKTAERTRIVEVDIRFSASESWWYRSSRYVDPLRCSPPEPREQLLSRGADCDDLTATAIHEVGHGIGLLHTCDASPKAQKACSEANKAQTMNGVGFNEYRSDNLRFEAAPANHRTLGIGDIRSMRTFYPPLS